MSTAASQRPAEHGSRTLTLSPAVAAEAGPSNDPGDRDCPQPIGMLKLRGGPVRKQKVMWSDETIDNEGMGKKKSKICCIYHRPKAYDESSSESESSSNPNSESEQKGAKFRVKARRKASEPDPDAETSSDGGQGNGAARPARKPPRHHRKHRHSHDCSHGQAAPRPNKYDHQDKSGSKGTAVNGVKG